MKKTIETWGEIALTVIEDVEEDDCNQEDSIFDIVLCNLKLHDGWISTKTIKKIKKNAKRFILLSGLADDTYYNLYSSTEYLLKPFNAIQLKAKIYQSYD